MAYTPSAIAPRDLALADTPAATRARPGFFARLLAAAQQARMRQAEREVARYLAYSTGGKLTDDAEREIERRFLAHQTRW